MTTYKTDWIPDIEMAPRTLRRLADMISDAIDDELSGLVNDIACQYIPSLTDDDLEGDAFAEQVQSPLYDRLLMQVMSQLINLDED